MAQPLLSPKLGTWGVPSGWADTPSSCSWALVAVGWSMGRIYPGQTAARTGSDHWPGSAVQGQGSGALMWVVAVHWVRWPWSFSGSKGQGQPWLGFCLGPRFLKYKCLLKVFRNYYTFWSNSAMCPLRLRIRQGNHCRNNWLTWIWKSHSIL